jgi:hypothetical protein
MKRTSLSFFNHAFYSKFPNSHSTSHLDIQQRQLWDQLIPARRVTLPLNTSLIGLNRIYAKPYYLGTLPMYHPDILQKLSLTEKREWLDMANDVHASIGRYRLNQTLECLMSRSDQGVPRYYIDPRYLSVSQYLPIKENLGLVDEESPLLLNPFQSNQP